MSLVLIAVAVVAAAAAAGIIRSARRRGADLGTVSVRWIAQHRTDTP